MIVTNEVILRDYIENENNFWSGAKDRIKEWKNNSEIMDYLESYISDIFYDYDKQDVVISDVELNDFIWFEAEDLLIQYDILNEVI